MDLRLTSPYTRSRAARNAQWLLAGNNRYANSDLPIKTYRKEPNGVWDLESGHAADRARYWLGYPKGSINLGTFKDQIYGYLLPRTNRLSKPLPTTYRLRRAARIAAEKRRLAALAAQRSRKSKALAIALANLGVEESPRGSNRTKFGAWYGMNGVPWCAIFVTYCRSHAGATSPRTALAKQWEWWARARQHGFSITYNPEPGDIVVYDYGNGHVGFFKRWINRAAGTFETVEGNTSVSSNDNGGKVMVRQRSLGSGSPAFVRWN